MDTQTLAELAAGLEAGEDMEVPLWIQDRFARLGRDPNEWRGGGSLGEE